MAGILTSALQLGLLDTHLDKLVAILKASLYLRCWWWPLPKPRRCECVCVFQGRMLALCSALTASLPEGCAVRAPAGGYFVWVRLPAWVDARRLHRFASDAHRVSAFPGSIFTPAADADAARHHHCIRLAVAFHDERRLAAAARDLSAAIAEYMQRGGEV